MGQHLFFSHKQGQATFRLACLLSRRFQMIGFSNEAPKKNPEGDKVGRTKGLGYEVEKTRKRNRFMGRRFEQSPNAAPNFSAYSYFSLLNVAASCLSRLLSFFFAAFFRFQ